MSGVQRDHILAVVGRRWRRRCDGCWRFVMDHLWRCRLMMLNRLLAEPRQMGTQLPRRQRIDDFNGIRGWWGGGREQNWKHYENHKKEESVTQRRNKNRRQITPSRRAVVAAKDWRWHVATRPRLPPAPASQ